MGRIAMSSAMPNATATRSARGRPYIYKEEERQILVAYFLKQREICKRAKIFKAIRTQSFHATLHFMRNDARFSHIRAVLKKDTLLKWVHMTLNGKLASKELDVAGLDGIQIPSYIKRGRGGGASEAVNSCVDTTLQGDPDTCSVEDEVHSGVHDDPGEDHNTCHVAENELAGEFVDLGELSLQAACGNSFVHATEFDAEFCLPLHYGVAWSSDENSLVRSDMPPCFLQESDDTPFHEHVLDEGFNPPPFADL